ncbi:MAG: hypothetical protein HY726_07670 [Candidatus Rokubacteria bacterium]|nr:hypothetical protein [Candidatus Rokubacteria bacterium]
MPAHHRVENPALDGAKHLRDRPEEAEVRGPVARGPVAVKLGLPGLREHVEPDEPAIRRALREVEAPHAWPVQDLAGLLVDQRYLEGDLCTRPPLSSCQYASK